MTFTALHVVTTVTDPYASINVVSAVLPFTSPYRRIWLGLGTVAFDLLLAVLITSLFRVRVGLRAWRLVHWAGYVCWPVALIHAVGTGTDGAARWVLAGLAACAVAVAAGRGMAAGRTAGPGTRRCAPAWRPPPCSSRSARPAGCGRGRCAPAGRAAPGRRPRCWRAALGPGESAAVVQSNPLFQPPHSRSASPAR